MQFLMDILRVKVKSNVVKEGVFSLQHLSPAGEKAGLGLLIAVLAGEALAVCAQIDCTLEKFENRT